MSVTPNLVLPPLSALYAAVTKARLAAYRRGLLQVTTLPVPVVSVGNLTTGGTGKTPLVEFVCRVLAGNNWKVCILTRGYGRANPKDRVVVSDGSKVQASYEITGDEPLLLAEALKGTAAVVSDADRIAAGKWAILNLGAEVFVLDDGFQHLRLARDFNIVTIDATNPWGGGHLLPYGGLREPRRSLERADCVMITRANQSEDLDSLAEEIGRISDSRPIFRSVMKLKGITGINSDSTQPLDALPQPTVAFAAIGNPEAFFDQLQRAHVDLLLTRAFPDHHQYTQKDVDGLARQSKQLGARSLITTAKDGVKLRMLSFDLSCYALDIEVAIDEQNKFVNMILAAIAK